MATLYLHIGTHKTGTTAIQAFCDANRAALARHGYCFPIAPCKFGRVSLNINGHFLVAAKQAPDGSFENPREGRLWRRRLAVIAGHFRRYPNVILSDEMLWNESSFGCKGLWRNLKREADALGFDVRIIVYFRRQDQFIRSLWAQRVKAFTTEHGKMRWEEALAQADSWIELDYYRHLEEIAAVFGRDAIDVRLYDRRRFPEGNIISDFLSAIGLTMDGSFSLPGEDANPSIGGNALEIKRIVNNVPGIRYAQLVRARSAVEAYDRIEKERATYSMFSDAELRDFLARYEESNRLLSRDYLGGGDESPFPPPEPQPPKWTPANPYMCEAFERFIEMYMAPRMNVYVAWLGRFFAHNWRRLRQVLPGSGGARAN